MMAMEKIRVLLIEDNPGDALLVEEALLTGVNTGRYTFERAVNLGEGLERLKSGGIDILLLDLNLPDSTGIETFTRACGESRDVPIIILTSLDDEMVADSAVGTGAQDYIAKGDIEGKLLGRAIRYAIERKRSELELWRANAELEGYANTVSHDLKSPLASIGAAAQMLELLLAQPVGEIDPPEVAEITQILTGGVERAGNLIDEILMLAAAGQMPAEVTDVDVRVVVDRVLGENAWVCERMGMEVQVDKSLGSIRANATQVYQVFSNLISNAIKYNSSAEPVVEVSYLGETFGAGHRYMLKDNGPGIPAEDLNKIFLPYFKGRKGGTGIGLSIVQKIVHLYDGELRVYNDRGACFDFTLKDMVE
jgi:two-component system sensor histidine kinase/response regulator